MYYEWSGFFEYVCSYYNGEIADLLKNTEYRAICDKLSKQEMTLLSEPSENNMALYNEILEKKAACYYEQAAVVALKHFMKLIHETEII